ncbi:MAG TPA: hypothetical protein VF152_15395 [Acidimicrobiia bacterium]
MSAPPIAAPGPDAMAERLRLVRMLAGAFATGYLLVRLPQLLALGGYDEARFEPVGVLAGLESPLAPALWGALVLAAIPLGVAFSAGRRLAVTAPAFALLLLVVTTYRNSWGQVFHTENLLVLQVIVLAVALALPRPDPAFVIRLLALVTVTTYVVSGVAKLRSGAWDWVAGDTLRDQVAYDNLRKATLGAPYSPLGAWAVGHAWIFPPLAVATLAVELGAPLALVRPRWALAWVACAWTFHLGVLALMAIFFPYPLLGVAFAPLLPLERIPRWLRRRRARDPARSPLRYRSIVGPTSATTASGSGGAAAAALRRGSWFKRPPRPGPGG